MNEDTLGWASTLPTPQVVARPRLRRVRRSIPISGSSWVRPATATGHLLSQVTFSNSQGGLGYYFVMNLPNTTLNETKCKAPLVTPKCRSAPRPHGVHKPVGHLLGRFR